jgi:integrase
MSPERTSEGGQFRSRWKRAGFGVIRLTYGFTKADHYAARKVLDELWDNNQIEVLHALQKKKGEPGRVTIQELLAAKKAGRHKRDDVLVDLRLQRGLWETLEQMIKDRPGGTRYKRRLRASAEKFAKSPAAGILGVRATIADLRRVKFTELRAHFGGAVDWNQFRKMLGVTLTQLLEDHLHPFRREIMKKIPKEPEPHHDVDITVDQFWALIEQMPEHARPGVVTLAATGMRLNTEYLACSATSKREELPGVYCPGSKTADASGIIPVAAELWPWVDAGIPAPVKERWLRIYFHRAAVVIGLARMIKDPRGRIVKRGPKQGEPLQVYDGPSLHDLRHLALQLALDGGAQLNDVQALARHTDPAMTMRYLKRSGRRRAADAIGRQLLPKKEVG